MSSKLHLLYEGHLSDMPGRDESWTEKIRYRGANRWLLVAEGTSFGGICPGWTNKEEFGTRALIEWVLKSDAADQENWDSRNHPEDDDESTEDITASLTGRSARLLEIAQDENATYCAACLEGLLAGTWSPKKREPVPRILEIKGVTMRGVWLHMYRPAYSVETTLGSGYLEQPDEHRMASLFVLSKTYRVRIPKHLLTKISALTPEFDALTQSRSSALKP